MKNALGGLTIVLWHPRGRTAIKRVVKFHYDERRWFSLRLAGNRQTQAFTARLSVGKRYGEHAREIVGTVKSTHKDSTLLSPGTGTLEMKSSFMIDRASLIDRVVRRQKKG